MKTKTIVRGKTYACKKTTAVVYTIKLKEEGGWGTATIREWQGGGSIDIQSDYGNYAFTWGSIGEDCFRAFLVDLNMDYAMKKLTGYDMCELYFDDTIKAMKKEIIDTRKRDELTSEEAREAWDDMTDNIIPSEETMDGILKGCYETEKMLDIVYGGDLWGVNFVDRVKPQVQMFWDKIWLCFVDVWKEELKNEN